MKPNVEYLPDRSVDNALDQELRELLTTCFTKAQDVVFRTQRYFAEPYPHRWVIRNEVGAIVSHVGVHEKQVEAGDHTYRIGGIAEVCVHPDYRGKGYVRLILARVHVWLREQGFDFAVLFGNPLVYRSSGYAQVTNLLHGKSADGWKQVNGLIRELSETPWPDGDVHLPGPKF